MGANQPATSSVFASAQDPNVVGNSWKIIFDGKVAFYRQAGDHSAPNSEVWTHAWHLQIIEVLAGWSSRDVFEMVCGKWLANAANLWNQFWAWVTGADLTPDALYLLTEQHYNWLYSHVQIIEQAWYATTPRDKWFKRFSLTAPYDPWFYNPECGPTGLRFFMLKKLDPLYQPPQVSAIDPDYVWIGTGEKHSGDLVFTGAFNWNGLIFNVGAIERGEFKWALLVCEGYKLGIGLGGSLDWIVILASGAAEAADLMGYQTTLNWTQTEFDLALGPANAKTIVKAGSKLGTLIDRLYSLRCATPSVSNLVLATKPGKTLSTQVATAVRTGISKGGKLCKWVKAADGFGSKKEWVDKAKNVMDFTQGSVLTLPICGLGLHLWGGWVAYNTMIYASGKETIGAENSG